MPIGWPSVTDPVQAAVVILNYNGRRLLPEGLAGLDRLTTPAEVVVADNASTEGRAQNRRVDLVVLSK